MCIVRMRWMEGKARVTEQHGTRQHNLGQQFEIVQMLLHKKGKGVGTYSEVNRGASQSFPPWFHQILTSQCSMLFVYVYASARIHDADRVPKICKGYLYMYGHTRWAGKPLPSKYVWSKQKTK